MGAESHMIVIYERESHTFKSDRKDISEILKEYGHCMSTAGIPGGGLYLYISDLILPIEEHGDLPDIIRSIDSVRDVRSYNGPFDMPAFLRKIMSRDQDH